MTEERREILVEKGIQRVVNELALSDGNLDFLGIVSALDKHPQIANTSNCSHPHGKKFPDEFSRYRVNLKTILNKEEIADILNEIYDGEFESFEAQDDYGPCFSVFFRPTAPELYVIEFYGPKGVMNDR